MRRVIVLGFAVLLIWVLWPVYGFASNQLGFAQSPLGWRDVPEALPAAQDVRDDRYAEMGDEAMRALGARQRDLGLPSLSAAVAIDGRLVWAGAVGWQDVEASIPATPRTVYRIGSTSKAVTATVLARLVADGRMDLDAPLSTYVSGLPNDAWRPMTARQLASHTAGLPNYEENTDWVGVYHTMALRRAFGSPTDALTTFDESDLLYEPGSGFHYTSLGTVLLSAAIESGAGDSYATLLDQEVAAPLGLTSLRPDRSGEAFDVVAEFYQRRQGRVKPWRGVDLSSKTAAGGLVASPADLARLGVAWLDDAFVPSDIRSEFWTPVRLPNGEVNAQQYALGWRQGTTVDAGEEMVHLNHGGVSKGAQAWLMVVPGRGLAIALATNARTDSFADFSAAYTDVRAAFAPMLGDEAEVH